ncbi:MAG: LysR substrate-binding domain-containing protein [Ilumatobacter sp.]
MRELVRRLDRLQRLAVFESAARLGSFTGAARELGMTQPAATRHIRALERSLGADLFTRTTNRSQLSTLGRRLFEHVSAGFDTIESGIAELDEHGGDFVLAAHPGIAQQWLLPRIDRVHELLGDLELRLWMFDGDAAIADGGFDAAIRVGVGDDARLHTRLLFPEIVVPVAAPSFAEAHGLDANSTAADVFRAPFVHMDDGDSPWMTWSEWLDDHDIVLRRQPGRVLYNNYPMVLQQAIAGRGVALGWLGLVDDLVDSGVLRIVGPEVRSSRGYHLTWPTGTSDEVVRPILDWLLDEFAPLRLGMDSHTGRSGHR